MREPQPIGELGLLIQIFRLLDEIRSAGVECETEALEWCWCRINQERNEIDWRQRQAALVMGAVANTVQQMTGCDSFLIEEAARGAVLPTRAAIVLDELRRYKSAYRIGEQRKAAG